MNAKAKALYDEARALYEKARGIQGQFKSNEDIPGDKLEEVNVLLDAMEAKKTQADAIVRMEAAGSTFTDPVEDISLPGAAKREDPTSEWQVPVVSNEAKSLVAIAGMSADRIKVSPFTMDEAHYDPDRSTKHAIATLLYWKYGEKNLDNALQRLPGPLAKLASELKDLATQPGAAGGFFVADTHLNRLIELQANVVAMRSIATVLPPIPGGSAITPSEENELSDPVWTHELGTGTDDVVEPFGERALSPHPLAKRIKISRTLLRAATLLNIEAWVLDRLARKFSDAEENNFINGDGSQKPFGLLSAPISSIETEASNVLAPDDLINWAYQLPTAYARRATIATNRSFIRKVRLMRTDEGGAGTGDYMWQPGLSAGSPATILDWPYVLSDFYPTGLTADAYDDNALVATIGDFSYYWIVDSLNFEVQRLDELYAATNQVGYIGRKEADGMVVAADAFRNLEIKA